MDPVRRKKRKSKSLWIGGIAAAVILLIGGGVVGYAYWRDQQRQEAAETASANFVAALENKAFDELAPLLDEASLEEIGYTSEEVIERYTTIFNGIGADTIQSNQLEVIEEEETSTYTATYNLLIESSIGELPEQSYQFTLNENEDGFKVVWGPELIFPEMQLGDTVQVNQTPAKRGSILDRQGELLAGEGEAYQVGIYPQALGEGDEREAALQSISETFNVSVNQLETRLAQSWVTPESFVPFAIRDEGETPEVPGILYQLTTARLYPLKEAAAHIVGYVGEVTAEDIANNPSYQAGELIGKTGLEAAFDERLRGQSGGKIAILREDGEVRQVLKESSAEDGEDVQLTLDKTLQLQAYNTLEGESGSAVVIDPTTGELLVVASSPSYDPVKMSRGISTEEYQSYAEDERSPFLSRYAARYAPGSTFKVLTAAIGLDAGTLMPEEVRNIEGLQWTKDASWGSDAVTRVSDAATEVDLEAAFVYSDNIYFAQEALEMGSQTFSEGLNQFPFGDNLNLPFSMEPAQFSSDGTFHSEKQLADTAYGQGEILMSPVQQASFYSAIANDGAMPMPQLLQGEEVQVIEPISKEAANLIEDMLVQTVDHENGTARALQDLNLPMAAKTGTAEFRGAGSEVNETNGFLLTYDAENHQFLMVAMLENKASGDVIEAVKSFLPRLFQR